MADGFKTSDTQLASTLVAIGHSLRGLEGPQDRRVFVFDASAEPDRLKYATDQLAVSPRKLFGAYRDLKAAIFAAQ